MILPLGQGMQYSLNYQNYNLFLVKTKAQEIYVFWSNKNSLHTMYIQMDVLQAYTFMAKSFEKDDLQIYDIPEIRSRLIDRLESMIHSPLGEDDNFVKGYELSFLESLKTSNIFSLLLSTDQALIWVHLYQFHVFEGLKE